MQRKSRLVWLLVVIFALISIAGACGGDGGDATGEDDDGPNPPDDDLIPDDDTGDDDMDDDSDDDNDDDISGPDPVVIINDPDDGEELPDYDVILDADLYNIDDPANVTVFLDGMVINETVTISTTRVYGEFTAPMGGDFTFRIEAVNDHGTGFDQADFHIDKPWIRVDNPQAGEFINVRLVEVEATYGNCDDEDISVNLDDTPITGSLFVYGGQITGEIESIDVGDHLMLFHGERGADEVDVPIPFFIELEDPHFDLSASSYHLTTGEYADLEYKFFDEDGFDITGVVDVDISVDPALGTVIQGDRVWFYYGGTFEVSVGTLYQGNYYTASVFIYVDQGEVYELDIELSDDEIAAGETVTVTSTITDINGNPVYAEVIYSVDPPFGATIVDYEITLTYAGVITVRGNVAGTGVYDEEEVLVNPAEPYDVFIYCDRPSVEQGESVTCEADVEDIYGNPIEIGTYFTAFPNTGVTQVDNVFTFEAEGVFILTAHVDGHPSLEDSTMVEVVDVTPPDLVFISPERGFYTHVTSLDVSGYVYDIDPYTASLEINGSSVYLEPQGPNTAYFSTAYTLANGLNILEAIAEDGSGNTAKASTSIMLGQEEWPNDAYVTDAMGLRISEKGFDQIEIIINGFLLDLDFEPIIMSMNPIFDERVEFWGMTIASAKAWVTGVEQDNCYMNFEVYEDYIDTVAGLPRLKLWIKASGSILGIGYTVYGHVTATNIALNAQTTLAAVNNEIVVEMGNFNLVIGNLNISIDGFPDELLDQFEDDVQDLIENTVDDLLSQTIPPLLEELMSQIPYDFDFQVGEATFNVGFQPTNLDPDGDGVTFWMRSRVQTDTINPIVPTFDGSFKTPSNSPTFGHYIPGTAQTYGFGIALGDDIVNQILYQVYRSGMLHQDFEQVFNACDALIYAVFPPICDTYGDVPLTIKMRPLLPPIILFEPAKFNAVNTEIQMGDLLLHLYTDDGNTQELVLTLATSTILPATISHDYYTNALSVDFDTPEVVVDTISNPLALNEDLFEALAPVLIELITPIFSQALQGFELPSFDGWTLQMEQMFAIGGGYDFIGIYAELIREP